MGIRLIRKVFDLTDFPTIPGIYEIKGPFTHVVAVEKDELGKVGLLLIQDPSIEEGFHKEHERWQQKMATWKPSNTVATMFAPSKPREPPEEPVMLSNAKIVVLREGENQPLLDRVHSSLGYLGSEVGKDGRLYFFGPVLNTSSLFGEFGSLFGSI